MISVKPGDQRLHHDVGSICHMTPDFLRHFTTAFAVTEMGTAFSVQNVPGHALVTKEPDYISCPFVLKITADIDMYVGAIKHFDGVPYYYAVPAEKVKTFKAPTPPAVVSPEALWTSVKCSAETVLGVVPIADTETVAQIGPEYGSQRAQRFEASGRRRDTALGRRR